MFASQPTLICISLRKPRIEPGITEEKLHMFRLSLYVVGISACVVAWAVYRNEQKKIPMPVTKAAAMLQQAWADHHTSV